MGKSLENFSASLAIDFWKGLAIGLPIAIAMWAVILTLAWRLT